MPPLEARTMLHWKPLLLCPHAELSRRLRTVLLEMGMVETHIAAEYPRPGEAEAIALQQRSNICFLDVASSAEEALALIPEILGVMPVVALHPEKDADLILRCLRKGACEFLADPSVDAVRGVFDRLAGRTGKPHETRGTVYCTVPGKPGCGASTVAAHLALHLHAEGKRKVLLVDADPIAGSIGFMLKLKAEFHLGDVARDLSRLDDELWRRLRATVGGHRCASGTGSPYRANPTRGRNGCGADGVLEKPVSRDRRRYAGSQSRRGIRLRNGRGSDPDRHHQRVGRGTRDSAGP